MSTFTSGSVDLELGRYDLGNVGSIRPSCLLTLPSASQNKRQKFVIGDPNGAVTCYVVNKKLGREELWKLQLSSSAITSLALGGLKALKDQIFVGADTTIWGVKKVGKEFFRFSTPLAEPIRQLYINNLRLHVMTQHTYSVFEQQTDISSYTVGDTITDATPVVLDNGSDVGMVLACQVRYACLLWSYACRYILSAPIFSPPFSCSFLTTPLCLYHPVIIIQTFRITISVFSLLINLSVKRSWRGP